MEGLLRLSLLVIVAGVAVGLGGACGPSGGNAGPGTGGASAGSGGRTAGGGGSTAGVGGNASGGSSAGMGGDGGVGRTGTGGTGGSAGDAGGRGGEAQAAACGRKHRRRCCEHRWARRRWRQRGQRRWSWRRCGRARRQRGQQRWVWRGRRRTQPDVLTEVRGLLLPGRGLRFDRGMRRRRVRIAGPGCAASRHSGCLQDAFRFRQHPVLESLRLRQGLHRRTGLPLRRGVPSRRHARNLQSLSGLRQICPTRGHSPADPGGFLSGPASGSHRPRSQGANTAKQWYRNRQPNSSQPGRTGGSTPLNPAQPGVEPGAAAAASATSAAKHRLAAAWTSMVLGTSGTEALASERVLKSY